MRGLESHGEKVLLHFKFKSQKSILVQVFGHGLADVKLVKYGLDKLRLWGLFAGH